MRVRLRGWGDIILLLLLLLQLLEVLLLLKLELLLQLLLLLLLRCWRGRSGVDKRFLVAGAQRRVGRQG